MLKRSKLDRESQVSAKNIVIVNLIMMAYEAKLDNIFAREFEYNPILQINSEAPDIMSLRMKLLSSHHGIKRVFPE
jgi:hypothetical protein